MIATKYASLDTMTLSAFPICFYRQQSNHFVLRTFHEQYHPLKA